MQYDQLKKVVIKIRLIEECLERADDFMESVREDMRIPDYLDVLLERASNYVQQILDHVGEDPEGANLVIRTCSLVTRFPEDFTPTTVAADGSSQH